VSAGINEGERGDVLETPIDIVKTLFCPLLEQITCGL